MKFVNLKLSEYEAQTVLRLLDNTIDILNADNPEGKKERLLPIDPLGIGVDNYINIADQIEEILENK
jgi:hypothetical protein